MTPDCAPDSQELDEHHEPQPLDEQRAAVKRALDAITAEDMTGRPTASAVVGDYTALSTAMQKLQRRDWRANRL